MTKYGQTWWGTKWMNALSHIDYSNRLPRGQSYASKGAVALSSSGRVSKRSLLNLENNEKVLIFTQFREMGLILQGAGRPGSFHR